MIKCSCNQEKCTGYISVESKYADGLLFLFTKNSTNNFASIYLNAHATKKLIKELQSTLKELEE